MGKKRKKSPQTVLRFKYRRKLQPATEALSTCPTAGSDVHNAHTEPSGLAGRRKSRHSLIVRDTHDERGRAAKCSRSSLAMPQRKPVGSRGQCSSRTPCSHAEPAPPRKKCHQLLPRRPWQQAVRCTVMSMWSKGMACMGAWLGGRGLTYGSGRTHPEQRERQRARPPTVYRAAASSARRFVSRVIGGSARRTTEAAVLTRFETRKRACRGPFRSALSPLLPCRPEAPHGPSTAVRSFFRSF
jgi:hypothetical protein